jgi:hypothetical protein
VGRLSFEDLEPPMRPDVLELAAKTTISTRDDLGELSHVLVVTDRHGTVHRHEYLGAKPTGLDRRDARAVLAKVASEVDSASVASAQREQAILNLQNAADLAAVIATL